MLSPYYFEYWAGIDCNGLVLQSLRYAEKPADYEVDQQLSGQGLDNSELPGIRVGNVSMTPCTGCPSADDVHANIWKGPLMNTNVQKIFDRTNKDLFYYWEKTEKGSKDKSIHRGDFIRYADQNDVGTHISTVHSPKADCNADGSNCTYKIIHAHGRDQVDIGTRANPSPIFTRKVRNNWNNEPMMPNPTGFGIIKLWD